MKKETLLQRLISWAYVKYVLLPELDDGGSVLITMIEPEIEKWEIKQAMYEKKFNALQ